MVECLAHTSIVFRISWRSSKKLLLGVGTSARPFFCFRREFRGVLFCCAESIPTQSTHPFLSSLFFPFGDTFHDPISAFLSNICHIMTQQAAASLNLTISSSSSSESGNPECNLFDDFGVAVQILMGTLAFGSLLIKRTNEFPQRPWKIWMFDTTKQGLGACFSHFLNTTLGILFGLSGGGDACTWSESTQCVLGYFPSLHFYFHFGVCVCV
jgi:hypothetical protein